MILQKKNKLSCKRKAHAIAKKLINLLPHNYVNPNYLKTTTYRETETPFAIQRGNHQLEGDENQYASPCCCTRVGFEYLAGGLPMFKTLHGF